MDFKAHYTDGKTDWVEHHVGFDTKKQAWSSLKRRYRVADAKLFWLEEVSDLNHDWERTGAISYQCRVCGAHGVIGRNKQVRLAGRRTWALSELHCNADTLLSNTRYQAHYVSQIRKAGFEEKDD